MKQSLSPTRMHVRVGLIIFGLFALTAAFVAFSIHYFNNQPFGYSRTDFLNDVMQHVGIFTALLFLLLVYSAKLTRIIRALPAAATGISLKRSLGAWGAGFLVAALCTTGVIYIVNPRAQYNTQLFIPLANPSRFYKPAVFLNVEQPPDVVVTGSSRVFTIQPDYIQETLGLSAFNFSFDSGKINDALMQARFMEAEGKFPRVLMIEIREGLLPYPPYTVLFSSPLMQPFMPLESTLLPYLQTRLEGLFSLQHFAEAIYTFHYMRGATTSPGWQFQPDGGGDLPGARLEDVLPAIQVEVDAKTAACPRVLPEGIQDAEALLQLAGRHHASVIFFLLPQPQPLYETVILNNPEYEQCINTLTETLSSLREIYPNLFFLDFTDTRYYAGLSLEEAFFDGRHLTTLGNQQIIDAAAETILEAYQRAQQSSQSSS